MLEERQREESRTKSKEEQEKGASGEGSRRMSRRESQAGGAKLPINTH